MILLRIITHAISLRIYSNFKKERERRKREINYKEHSKSISLKQWAPILAWPRIFWTIHQISESVPAINSVVSCTNFININYAGRKYNESNSPVFCFKSMTSLHFCLAPWPQNCIKWQVVHIISFPVVIIKHPNQSNLWKKVAKSKSIIIRDGERAWQ